MPVKGQLGRVIEAVAMVVGSSGQCLDGLVKVLKDLSPVLEGPGLVLSTPSFSFSFSFSNPSPILALVSPPVCDEPTGNASSQSAHYADASYDQRDPKGRSTHASMMEASTVDSVEAGHIGGTSLRDLPGSVQNFQDPSRSMLQVRQCLSLLPGYPSRTATDSAIGHVAGTMFSPCDDAPGRRAGRGTSTQRRAYGVPADLTSIQRSTDDSMAGKRYRIIYQRNRSMRKVPVSLTGSGSDKREKTCFVAMPISTPGAYTEKLGDPDHFAHVLVHLFTPALEEAGLTVIPPSTVGSELIHAEIIRNLEQADFVLCDLSGLNPNVLFELGVRTSLDRPVILVKDDLTEKAPFDLNAINTLTYDSSMTPWSLASERSRLVKHIQGVINSGNSGNSMWRYFGLTKRGEPSQAGDNPIEAKLDLLLGEISKFQPTSNSGTNYSGRRTNSASPFLDILETLFPGIGYNLSFERSGDRSGYRLNIDNYDSLRQEDFEQISDAAAAAGFPLLTIGDFSPPF